MTREKVELDDIIGIVKTDEPTDSVELKKEIYNTNPSLRHQPIEAPEYDVGAFYVVKDDEAGETCPVIINGYAATNGYVASLLNEWNDWIIELQNVNKNLKEYNISIKDFYFSLLNENEGLQQELKEFKENTFKEIDKRINTLKANSRQCHESGSHDKGMEFTSQAEVLERLKKALKENLEEE